jgi:hypothetical protein
MINAKPIPLILQPIDSKDCPTLSPLSNIPLSKLKAKDRFEIERKFEE